MVRFKTLLSSPRTQLAIVFLYLLLAFGIDLMTPRGYSVWVLYLMAVVLGMRRFEQRHLLLISLACSLFTILGLLVSPSGVPMVVSALGHLLALLLIWTAFAMAASWQRADERLARLQKAVDDSGEVVFMTDREGVFTLVNPAFTTTYGYSAEEVIGKATPRILKSGKVLLEEYAAHWAELLAKKPVHWEVVNKTKDGAYLTMDASINPIVDARGKIAGFLAIQRDITDRKRAEEELRESHERLKKVLEVETVGVMFWDLNTGCMIDANDTFLNFMGYSRQDVEARELTWQKLTPPEFFDVSLAEVKKFQVTGRVGPYEKEYFHKDGSRQWFVFAGSSLGNNTCVEFCVDISERKKAEEAVRNLQKRLSLAFNAGPEPMTISTLSRGVYVDVNEAFLRVTGYRRDEIIGRSSLSTKFWSSPERRRTLLDELRKGSVHDFEITFLTKSGEGRTGLLSGEIINVDGEACLLAVTKDITERKKSEEELKRLNRALRTISECNQALVRATNEDSLLESVCQILVEHGGFRMAWVGYADQDPGKSVRPVASAGDEEGYLEGLRLTWADQERGRGPTGTAIRTGRYAIARVIQDDPNFAPWREQALRRGYASSVALPLESDGKTFGALTVYSKDADAFDENEIALLRELASDLAFGIVAMQNRQEREQAEKNLKRTQEQFLQVQKMEAVGRLAGGVAHDFNNLLTIINGYADLLLSQIAKERQEREALEEIKKAGDRAAGLTRQLLSFSRKQVVELTELDLNAVVEGMEKMMRRLLGEDIQFVMRLSKPLGQMRADAGQIEQVLMNLAVNARDAMPKGGKLVIETTEIELSEEYAVAYPFVNPGQYVALIVSDTGIGMDAETQSHIFEPFFTTKDKGKGSGLGLATVYGIVKQSGGHVNVYSELGRGTTFRVYFPRTSGPVVQEKPKSEQAISWGGTETILLVEDEPGVRALAKQILESKGYTVLVAGEYLEALARSAQYAGTIHLLLTDVIMPGLNGKELAESLLALRPNLKVLFISGYTADAIAQHGILENGVAYLPKPFVPRELLEKVRSVLDG